MKAQIKKRIEIQKDVIDSIHNNIFLMHQLSNELKNTLLKENVSVMRIMFNSLAIAIIDLNKILKPSEGYSFNKILNLIENNRELKKNKHFQTLKSDSIRLYGEFEKTNLRKLRDEHIVHKDLNRGDFEFSLNEIISIFTDKMSLGRTGVVLLALTIAILLSESQCKRAILSARS